LIDLASAVAENGVPTSEEVDMASIQRRLIAEFFGPNLSSKYILQLSSMLREERGHSTYPWVDQVFRVHFYSLDVQGTHAGLDADVYVWNGADIPTTDGSYKSIKYKVKYQEYATLVRHGDKWEVVTDRNYLLPISGPASEQG
jgi:hypothetical protein